MIALEVITTLAGLVVPPAAKLIQNIFGKKESPQDALDDIALSRPEIMPQYIEGLSKLAEANTKWFNRDVTGDVSLSIRNLRAGIRPVTVAASVVILVVDRIYDLKLDAGVRASMTGWVSAWMSDRIL